MLSEKISTRHGLIFDEKTKSLVDYYILPLLKINTKTFGFYFVESKLVRCLDGIVVTILKECREKYWDHPNYQTDFNDGNKTHIIYSIPEEFLEDVKQFAEGSYSQMSSAAKEVIYKYSGLWYNKRLENVIVTDKLLLALTRSPILRKWMIDEFNVKIGKYSEPVVLEFPEKIYTHLTL